MNILIVDDEADARGILKAFCKRYSQDMQVCAEADSVDTAVQAITEHRPELVFLDVEIKGGSGFEVLEHFDPIDFEVIFVTAHNHYAIRAIKFSALDYLLKPVDISEFKNAVERARLKLERTVGKNTRAELLKEISRKTDFEKLALPTESGYVFVKISDIIRCEASSNYTVFHLNAKKSITISKTLKEYEELLAPYDFCRIHNSHLVNMSFVKELTRGKACFVTLSDKTTLPVSTGRKEKFLERFAGI